MPLEIRGQWGNKVFRSCQVKTCTRFAGKRVFFMQHYMGNVCQIHAKEWEAAWNGALETPEPDA